MCAVHRLNRICAFHCNCVCVHSLAKQFAITMWCVLQTDRIYLNNCSLPERVLCTLRYIPPQKCHWRGDVCVLRSRQTTARAPDPQHIKTHIYTGRWRRLFNVCCGRLRTLVYAWTIHSRRRRQLARGTRDLHSNRVHYIPKIPWDVKTGVHTRIYIYMYIHTHNNKNQRSCVYFYIFIRT